MRGACASEEEENNSGALQVQAAKLCGNVMHKCNVQPLAWKPAKPLPHHPNCHGDNMDAANCRAAHPAAAHARLAHQIKRALCCF